MLCVKLDDELVAWHDSYHVLIKSPLARAEATLYLSLIYKD
jgi:hypothetical protein